jgi:capsular polysaccharide biosynthesis protein
VPAGQLSAQTHDDVVLLPAQASSEWPMNLRLGAYDADRRPVDGVLIERFRDMVCARAPYTAPTGAAIAPSSYGGLILPHFGHFLLETLARAWWLTERPGERIVWHSLTPRLTAWQREVFGLLGLSVSEADLAMTARPVQRLTIADPGYVIGRAFHPQQAEALAVVPFGRPVPGSRVWLSRSSLPEGRGRVVGEAELEVRLRSRGWEILSPETLAIEQQLARLSQTERVAGFEGSAFHLLVFGRDVRAKVRIVHRGKAALGVNYRLIAERKRLDQTAIGVEMPAVSGSGAATSYGLAARHHAEIIRFVES